MTGKGQPQRQSWTRRGHYVSCWEIHERCALLSARDLMENRAAHAKAQAKLFGDNMVNLDRGEVDADWFAVELARKLLREYHASIRGVREA